MKPYPHHMPSHLLHSLISQAQKEPQLRGAGIWSQSSVPLSGFDLICPHGANHGGSLVIPSLASIKREKEKVYEIYEVEYNREFQGQGSVQAIGRLHPKLG